jgi:hypothetical protein
MTKLANDNFTRANENPLSGGSTNVWTVVPTVFPLQVAGNLCEGTSNALSFNGSYYSGLSWPKDQYAQIVVSTLNNGSNNQAGAIVRCSAIDQSCYLSFLRSDGQLLMYVYNGGFQTFLATVATSFGAGSILRLQVQGTTLSAFINGILIKQVTDASISSGSPGLYTATTSAVALSQISYWEGGNLLVPPILVVGDFISACSMKSYAVVANPDGTLTLTKGVVTRKVFFGWDVNAAKTDANPNGCQVYVFGNEGVGSGGVSDAQTFVNNLP